MDQIYHSIISQSHLYRQVSVSACKRGTHAARQAGTISKGEAFKSSPSGRGYSNFLLQKRQRIDTLSLILSCKKCTSKTILSREQHPPVMCIFHALGSTSSAEDQEVKLRTDLAKAVWNKGPVGLRYCCLYR